METTRQGKPLPPVVLLEMLEFRFGAFEAIAYAALELAGKEPEVTLPMDERTARAIVEFGDDLRQASDAVRITLHLSTDASDPLRAAFQSAAGNSAQL